MLRSSIVSSRPLLSFPVRQRAAPQWLSRAGVSGRLAGQRFFADSTNPNPSSATPATPSSDSTIPSENAPKNPPSPSAQGTSTPPPPPARKTGRFRRFLLYLILTSGLAYAGGVFLALKSDNFHDFFTEYVPYAEEVVLYFEERDFYRRFPNAAKRLTTPTPRDEGAKVTIPGKSGVSWKVSEEEEPAGVDVTKKGKHMSAIEANEEVQKKTAAVQKAEDKAAKVAAPAEPKKQEQPEKEEPRKPAISPVSLEQQSEEPIVQELVNAFNGIIAAISADAAAEKYTAPIEKAKTDLQRIAEKIAAIKTEAQQAAQEEIKKAHATFDESARELLRRIEEAREAEAAAFREEFEAEREKLSRSYQEKLQTELQRAQELAEARLKNELVEQAIELNRKYLNDVKELVEREREGRLAKLSELTANVNQLEKMTTEWSDVIDTNLKTQQLQVAVDAVRTALERSDMPRPFVRELVAVKELAGDDPVVAAAIASINPTAYQRGIPSSAQIVDRFRRVANEVRKASLLPEDAGIASHLASFLLSKVMFKKEATPDGNDVESILARTESLLEEGNLDAAAREMNQLTGWARILSKDWLADVRRVLEVRQALEVIETEARLQCLRVEQ